MFSFPTSTSISGLTGPSGLYYPGHGLGTQNSLWASAANHSSQSLFPKYLDSQSSYKYSDPRSALGPNKSSLPDSSHPSESRPDKDNLKKAIKYYLSKNGYGLADSIGLDDSIGLQLLKVNKIMELDYDLKLRDLDEDESTDITARNCFEQLKSNPNLNAIKYVYKLFGKLAYPELLYAKSISSEEFDSAIWIERNTRLIECYQTIAFLFTVHYGSVKGLQWLIENSALPKTKEVIFGCYLTILDKAPKILKALLNLPKIKIDRSVGLEMFKLAMSKFNSDTVILEVLTEHFNITENDLIISLKGKKKKEEAVDAIHKVIPDGYSIIKLDGDNPIEYFPNINKTLAEWLLKRFKISDKSFLQLMIKYGDTETIRYMIYRYDFSNQTPEQIAEYHDITIDKTMDKSEYCVICKEEDRVLLQIKCCGQHFCRECLEGCWSRLDHCSCCRSTNRKLSKIVIFDQEKSD